MTESQGTMSTIDKILLRQKDEGLYIREIEMEQLRGDYLPIMKGYALILRDMTKAALQLIQSNSENNMGVPLKRLQLILSVFFETSSSFYNDDEDKPIEDSKKELDVQMKLIERLWPVSKKYFFKMFDELKYIDVENELKCKLKFIQHDWRILHDAYTFSINSTLEMISELYSQHSAVDLLRQTALLNKSAYDSWNILDMESIGDVVRGLLIAHGSKFEIVHGTGEIIFKISYCASGGELMKNMDITQMDALGLTENDNNGRLADKYNYIPYCAHCKIWNEILPKEWYGREMFYVEPDLLHLESCNLIVKERD